MGDGRARAVMTVLEGSVAEGHWGEFVGTFEGGAARMPAQMLRSYLVQDTADPTRWRLIGVWRSRAALDEYQRSVATPGGVLMFRSVGVEPVLNIWEVGAAGPGLET